MKLATWNVNSLKSRLPHVLDWLAAHKPDFLLLQELKGTELPEMELQAAGYTLTAVAQKAYNGVAILSRAPVTVIHQALPGDPSDDQARYLEVEQNGTRIINIYAPNGNPIGTEKFAYKMAWLGRLHTRLADLRATGADFLIAGDFNIIPEDKDCYDPAAWAGDALFQPEPRAAYRALLHLGLTDALRALHPQPDLYTFWDYQAGAWPQNKGIRIDHILLSPRLADRLAACAVDKAPRGLDKPSDHTPVLIELA